MSKAKAAGLAQKPRVPAVGREAKAGTGKPPQFKPKATAKPHREESLCHVVLRCVGRGTGILSPFAKALSKRACGATAGIGR